MILTQAIVRELLHYDPEMGVFTWRERDQQWFGSDGACKAWNEQFAGKQNSGGHRQIRILGRAYLVHRLAWLYQTGAWPPDEIDHINRNPKDNRWSNLRLASHAENQRNTNARANNTSGFKGVSRNYEKWVAQIRVDGKRMHLGTFMTPEGASLAYRWAAERYHREFAGTAR
jgi:hypothetical protein